MAKMKSFEPISKLVIRVSRNVKQLLCSGIPDVYQYLVMHYLQTKWHKIVTIGPIIKELVDENVGR